MKAKLFAVLSVLLLLCGCSDEPPLDGSVGITDIPADTIPFKREYRVRINADVTMKVTAYSSHYDAYTTGELDQSGDRWVLFEPEKPADKILDRDILPTVEKFCAQILATDKQFRKSKPDLFVDEDGIKWTKSR